MPPKQARRHRIPPVKASQFSIANSPFFHNNHDFLTAFLKINSAIALLAAVFAIHPLVQQLALAPALPPGLTLITPSLPLNRLALISLCMSCTAMLLTSAVKFWPFTCPSDEGKAGLIDGVWVDKTWGMGVFWEGLREVIKMLTLGSIAVIGFALGYWVVYVGV